MEEEDQYEVEMAKTGSFACLGKQTITDLFECILSCVIFVSVIYIFILFLGLVSGWKTEPLYQVAGYISIAAALSAPIGLYGSAKGGYWCLLTFFVLSSYQIYALVVYIWLNIKSGSFLVHIDNTSKKYELTLHQVTIAAFTIAVILSFIMTSIKTISNTKQIEHPRVIVVDNNPSD